MRLVKKNKMPCLFNCYLCNLIFNDINSLIDHLRNVHKIKEKVNKIKCPVNKSCLKEFGTFSGLKKHVHSCAKKANANNRDDSNDNNNESNPVECIEYHISEQLSNILYIPEMHPSKPPQMKNEKTLENDDTFATFKQSITNMFGEVELLNLNKNAKDTVFQLLANLLNDMYKLNCSAIQKHSKTDVFETLSVTKDLAVNQIKNFSTEFKRSKFFAKDENYVAPEVRCIGTRIQMKTFKNLNSKLPVHIRNAYQYVPISRTLKNLFLQKDYRETYFDYNNLKKHKCVDGVYKDFCCGEIFKDNEFFKDHPNGIQLQLFVDGFEVCDPLKSSATKHSQVAFYFRIRNMPQTTRNLSNIHLVALCNSNYMKTVDDPYNNIWSQIVEDIKQLETGGLYGDNRLKGNANFSFILK